MDYSQLSDFEINRLVGDIIFKGLWACKPETSGNDTGKWYYGNADTTFGELKPLPNYCSKWDATGPIIEANGIGLRKQSNGLWCATRIGGEYPKYDKSPLRAAMIVFLQMQDAKHV